MCPTWTANCWCRTWRRSDDEPAAGTGQTQVTGQSQAKAAAHAGTVDDGQCGLRQTLQFELGALDLGVVGGKGLRSGEQLTEFVDIGAGTERPRHAGYHHDLGVTGGNGVQCGLDRRPMAGGQGVAFVGSVDADAGERAVTAPANHGFFSDHGLSYLFYRYSIKPKEGEARCPKTHWPHC